MSYDNFLFCIKALEQTPKSGTLYEYSLRLIDVSRHFYPAGMPRLIDSRITSLINTKRSAS